MGQQGHAYAQPYRCKHYRYSPPRDLAALKRGYHTKNGSLNRSQGMRRAGIILILIAAVLSLVVFQQTAYAEEGQVKWTWDPGSLLSDIRGSDGSRGYCAQAECNVPAGTFKEWHWISDMDEQTLRGDPHGFAWLLYHVYPHTSTFGDKEYPQRSAIHISQAAIWMYQGDMKQDRTIPKKHMTADCSTEEAQAAWQLAQEAHTHDKESGPWDHAAKYWVCPTNFEQSIVAIPPTGSVKITKSSGNAQLTADNPAYSLGGAVFGIYSDEGATQEVSRATLDVNGTATVSDLGTGTYYVKEISAPAGYGVDETVHSVEIKSSDTADCTVSDMPLYGKPDIAIAKKDDQTNDATPQGDASLNDAQFKISFYAGATDTNNLPESATKTWVMKTDDSGMIKLDNEHKVEGDDFYTLKDGTVVVPLGVIAIEETKAPGGYLLPENPRTAIAVQTDQAKDGVIALQTASYPEHIIHGGLAVQKLDSESAKDTPKGAATFEGTTFDIINTSNNAVKVAGKQVEPGAVALTITADKTGRAQTEADALPYGHYTVQESQAGKGYLTNSDWKQTVTIKTNGKMEELKEDTGCTDAVIRGDLSLIKANANTQQRMSKIPFKITSKTTGEWHIAITDENGVLDTSAGALSHTNKTNSNDQAVGEDGTVDIDKLDSEAGIWFFGSSNGTDANTISDERGALPYDTYTVEELPCQSNAGKKLVTLSLTIKRDNFEVHLGTVNNENGPSIHTELTSEVGEHTVPRGTETVVLVDTVTYSNLTPGTTYTLTGTLMDKATGEPLSGVAPQTAEFVPESENGEQEITFTIENVPETYHETVAFEKLTQDGTEVAIHTDIDDEGQTVHFSSLHTVATQADSDSHMVSAGSQCHLVDTVEYTGLIPHETYTLTATLHLVGDDGEDSGALLDAGGNVMTFTQEFVPENENGTCEVPINCDTTSLAGKHIVVFEKLTHQGKPVGSHEDIHDTGQSIVFLEHSNIPNTGDVANFPWTVGLLGSCLAAVGGINLYKRR